MSEWIAAVALFISVFSALYARWAGKATQRGNEIALLNERLKIYKALQSFRMTLITHGVAFPEEAIWPFIDHVNLSEFYFDEDFKIRLQYIVDKAVALKSDYEAWQDLIKEHSPLAKQKGVQVKGECRALSGYCERLDQELRKTLKEFMRSPSRLV